jgi:alpha 1,2-mannosyltransferase
MHRHIQNKLLEKYSEIHEILSSQSRKNDGIIICAGGKKLLMQAHYLLFSLQTLKNELPIQFFHYGDEVTNSDKNLIIHLYPSLSIEFIDLQKIPFCVNKDIRGFQIKAYALCFTRFKRIVYLDADIIPMHLPSSYMNAEDFLSTGAVFFPDYWIFHSSNKNAKITQYNDLMQSIFIQLTQQMIPDNTYEIESGFFIIDTIIHQNALAYFIALNDLHIYFYNFFYGDKELFRLAFMLAKEQFIVKNIYPNCIGSIINGSYHGFGMVQMLSENIISHIHMTILHVFDINYPINIIRKVKHNEPIMIKMSSDNFPSITFNDSSSSTEFFYIPSILKTIIENFNHLHLIS